jgi:hypothetical protein
MSEIESFRAIFMVSMSLSVMDASDFILTCIKN